MYGVLRMSRSSFPKGRSLSSSTKVYSNLKAFSRPGPPPLPAEDQREFEELVRKAQAPTLSSLSKEQVTKILSDGTTDAVETVVERHPDARKPLPPDFVGDVNPVTGEQGGPKQEPLKHGDWSFGGKVTDF